MSDGGSASSARRGCRPWYCHTVSMFANNRSSEYSPSFEIVRPAAANAWFQPPNRRERFRISKRPCFEYCGWLTVLEESSSATRFRSARSCASVTGVPRTRVNWNLPDAIGLLQANVK
jgi:hypothetical protein